MGFNPLEEKGIPLEKQIKNWSTVNVQPYNTNDVHPYTRTRVIFMNGIEVESALFMHQFGRHSHNLDLKRRLALARRAEQQQQKMVNWLIPADESTLEVTLGYEQVAVDLTAYLARTEPDMYVKAALDFALLEDFDHLYRYANLYEMDTGKDPAKIVGDLTEIMPGRPTIDEHRHPFDELRKHVSSPGADWLTMLHIATIVAAEQQTMNFYMNVGNRYVSELGRGLYLEIAQIEEQHVSHYESLDDPTMSWMDRWVLHDYNEAYLYYSCMQTETDQRIRRIWEEHLAMEIGHLQADRECIKQCEGRDIADMLPPEFPELTVFQSNKDYVRHVLETQAALTANAEDFVPIDLIPSDHRYYAYQSMVNSDGPAPSQQVIQDNISKTGQDYRFESEGAHPVIGLQERKATSRIAAG